MGSIFDAVAAAFSGIGIHPVFGSFLLGAVVCYIVSGKKRGVGAPALGIHVGTVPSVPPPGRGGGIVSFDKLSASLPAETVSQVQTLLRSGQKIEAIKVLREATGMGLKEAKDMTDALQKI